SGPPHPCRAPPGTALPSPRPSSACAASRVSPPSLVEAAFPPERDRVERLIALHEQPGEPIGHTLKRFHRRALPHAVHRFIADDQPVFVQLRADLPGDVLRRQSAHDQIPLLSRLRPVFTRLSPRRPSGHVTDARAVPDSHTPRSESRAPPQYERRRRTGTGCTR